MSQIFNYISYDSIYHLDNYNNAPSTYRFSNVMFRTHVSSSTNFFTPIGIHNNKIISVTNKQLSFLVKKYHHFLGDGYAIELKNTFDKIQSSTIDDILTVNDEVFQFFDYESINGTVHSYDLMFHLLYYYKRNNLTSKLLVVESNNKYYNSTLELIKKYFDVEYLYIKPYKTYLFKKFSCTRSYQNIFFNHVKEFINVNLIQPIINKYTDINEKCYDNVIKIKYKNPHAIDRLDSSYERTPLFNKFCVEKNVFDLNDIDDNEELKIFLLNKAKIIITTWGSSYYININYYLCNTQNKFISVIYHNNIMPETSLLTKINASTLNQNMPGHYCANITNQVYNNCSFEGEKIENISNIDRFVALTRIK
jgi:hypothetical protein